MLPCSLSFLFFVAESDAGQKSFDRRAVYVCDGGAWNDVALATREVCVRGFALNYEVHAQFAASVHRNRRQRVFSDERELDYLRRADRR